MFAYLFLQIIVFVHGKKWELLNSSMGYWYLTEIVGFVILPMLMFFYSYTRNSVNVARVAAIVTMIGIIINRLNVTVIGFRWDEAIRYVPTWMEFVVTLTVIFTEIWIFRWIINRMPVLRESPSWAKEQGH
jgi:membrane-associated HD superfamily phosphohydrolase